MIEEPSENAHDSCATATNFGDPLNGLTDKVRQAPNQS